MAMEKLNGKLVRAMKDNLKMEHLILKEKWLTLMEMYTKAISGIKKDTETVNY